MSGIELPRIINAAGHLSMLGGGISREEVADAISRAVRKAMTNPVDVSWLKDEASKRIASATGAEGGVVTTGAAAGIALSVAACTAGSELERVRMVPFGPPATVVLQAGHDIDFGASVTQMIALGGGMPLLAGSRDAITAADLDACLAGASALLFVQSHHVTTRGRLELATCIEVARQHGVPVIVDAAAEEDLAVYVTAGADLVVYSGGKALGGLSSSGFVAGRADLVAAVRAQERGIGRAMKVGPEQILSVIISLEMYAPSSSDSERVLATLSDALGGSHGAARFSIAADEAGRPIRRLRVDVPDAAGLARMLRDGDPPIYVRAHHAAQGYFLVDPRNLRMSDVEAIVEALRRAMSEA